MDFVVCCRYCYCKNWVPFRKGLFVTNITCITYYYCTINRCRCLYVVYHHAHVACTITIIVTWRIHETVRGMQWKVNTLCISNKRYVLRTWFYGLLHLIFTFNLRCICWFVLLSTYTVYAGKVSPATLPCPIYSIFYIIVYYALR